MFASSHPQSSKESVRHACAQRGNWALIPTTSATRPKEFKATSPAKICTAVKNNMILTTWFIYIQTKMYFNGGEFGFMGLG